jgi:sn-glycerol 3-phosphate transport system permease protein
MKRKSRRARAPWANLGPALLYMAPAIVLFSAFTFIPFLRAIYLSFFTVNRDTFQPAHFVGLGYYARIFNVGDSPFGARYLRSLLTSFEFALMVVPPSIILALGLAVLAHAKLKRIELFRTIFTSTVAISVASAGVIWALIFSPNLGLFKGLLEALGIGATGLLTDARTALPAVALTTVWTGLGFNFVIAFVGLQAIPKELYESGVIDGAGRPGLFWHITLPMLGPTLLFLLVMSTISAFEAFTQFKVLIDSAGPDQSTNVFVFAIFESFWSENNYGFASAMSVVLFLALLGLTLGQLKLDKKVHYQ